MEGEEDKHVNVLPGCVFRLPRARCLMALTAYSHKVLLKHVVNDNASTIVSSASFLKGFFKRENLEDSAALASSAGYPSFF